MSIEKTLNKIDKKPLIKNHLHNPIRKDAFELNDNQKIDLIQNHFKEIMHILGLDLTDDSIQNTPRRVAKMYVEEIFSGINPKNKPIITLFENKYQYEEMLIEKDITLYSYCEHHFVPIIGKVHIAYISNGAVIGLSKINRLVQFYAKRPQIQERLTNQIADGLKEALNSKDIAVMIDAAHLCVSSRGIKDTNTTTITTHFSGKFENEIVKNQFIALTK
ncbi:GTP cyclohydrolase I FolE [Flavobacterium sp. L1I52]|uniref:GTP cyclohydrolase 1 n=1 Tax=Flavobacterium pokkalii TaxID=1940408 RepID=A0ABR7US34_9FLAO|nr:GTP cyclohydrolase I FolE [Flavobacterium pokkalii]MBD0725514.1 GTP cyclohydrolase I FolE [Flavobacterium pokkalii]